MEGTSLALGLCRGGGSLQKRRGSSFCLSGWGGVARLCDVALNVVSQRLGHAIVRVTLRICWWSWAAIAGWKMCCRAGGMIDPVIT